jgi:hypothetical protein
LKGGICIVIHTEAARRAASVALIAAILFISARTAHAGCNIIPPAVDTFRSALASTDRPFAGPGDFVTLTIDARCHAA